MEIQTTPLKYRGSDNTFKPITAIQGKDGKINGKNQVNITAGDNISIVQTDGAIESEIEISVSESFSDEVNGKIDKTSISSRVDSDIETDVASSKAVKIAYDKALEAVEVDIGTTEPIEESIKLWVNPEEEGLNLVTTEEFDTYVTDKLIKKYNTVEELKAGVNLKIGDTIRTLGYYEINDGGGATYKLESLNTNVYQEKINDTLYATLIIEEVLNILQLGAHGDGVTDDTIILQQAIDYALNKNGSTILLPKGEYLISTVNIIKNIESNINIIGQGLGNTIIKGNPLEDSSVININYENEGVNHENKNILIKDLSIISLNTNNNTIGINAKNTTNNTFLENLYIEGFNKGIYAVTSWTLNIIECEVKYCRGDGIHIDKDSNHSKIKNSIIRYCDGAGIRVQSSSIIIIEENDIEVNKECGIFCSNVTLPIIRANYIENNSEETLELSSDIVLGNGNKSVDISSNYINSKKALNGIYILSGNTIKIKDNNFYTETGSVGVKVKKEVGNDVAGIVIVYNVFEGHSEEVSDEENKSLFINFDYRNIYKLESVNSLIHLLNVLDGQVNSRMIIESLSKGYNVNLREDGTISHQRLQDGDLKSYFELRPENLQFAPENGVTLKSKTSDSIAINTFFLHTDGTLKYKMNDGTLKTIQFSD